MKEKNLNRFCLVQNFGTPIQTSWSQIKELMKSAQVINICETIRSLDPNAADYNSTKNELKKQLPAITVHACKFDNNKRNNDAAWWNGLVVLEYDGLSFEEIDAFKNCIAPVRKIVFFIIVLYPNRGQRYNFFLRLAKKSVYSSRLVR